MSPPPQSAATAAVAVLDVHYGDTAAAAAAVLLPDWAAPAPTAEHRILLDAAAPYVPGQFKDRELPALRQVLAAVDGPLAAVVVDAYCTLSPEGAPGLGAYLYAALGHDTPVVGIAKNRFAAATHAIEVFRGGSRRALYVTACGLPGDEAAAHVARMAGAHRLPDAVKAADRLARGSV